VHWFDRSTGLNVLLDEVSVPRDAWHAAPRYVSIALTNACELRCSFCYAPKTAARLAPTDVLRWLAELDQAGCLGVGFGGGEPTSHPQFVELCERVTRETSLAVTFTTHGHRMSSEMTRRLKGSVHFIRVSMDGVAETYERIRGRSFDEFCRKVDLVSGIAPFGINVVINADTVPILDAVVDFARSVGAREVLLLPQQSTSNVPAVDETTERAFEDWVQQSPRRVPLAISEASTFPTLDADDPFRAEPALASHAHVDATGVLKANAYRRDGVAITKSILDSLQDLRRQEEAA
jgi:sulfatase maturation enzyme AslB (radical SAM superfamily)